MTRICNPKHPTHRGAPPGFTLLELMITFFIAAVVMAVAFPLTANLVKKRGARDAAIQLSMDLQRAKLLAIQRDVNCSITFINNQYTISITGEVVDLNKYPGGVGVSNAPDASDAIITFTPQGLCLNAGSVYLTDKKKNSRFRVRATIAGGVTVHVFSNGKWI